MKLTEVTRLMSELRRMGLFDTQIVDLVLLLKAELKFKMIKISRPIEYN